MSSETKGFTIVEVGSERSFGLVFAAVFAVIGLWPLIDGGSVRIWSLAIGAGFLGFAAIYPKALRPLNLIWFKFGLLLGKIVTPVVMALLFVSTVVPIGLIRRALGKDSLHLKHRESATYWISRPEPGPRRGTMKNQF